MAIKPDTTQPSEQTILPEAKEALHAPKHSDQLLAQLALGNFDRQAAPQDIQNQLDTSKPTAVPEKAYQALDAHHATQREADRDAFYLHVQQRYNSLSDEEKAQQKNPAEMNASDMRHEHMEEWARREGRGIKLYEQTLQDKPEEKTAYYAAMKKLDIDVEHLNEAKLKSVFYNQDTKAEGTFYTKFCKGDTTKKLADALEVSDMLAAKPFLVRVLGSQERFAALVALRETQDRLNASTPLSPTNSPLQSGEHEILDVFAEGLQKVPDTQPTQNITEAQASSPALSEAASPQAATEPVKRTGEVQKSTYQRPESDSPHMTKRSIAEIQQKETPAFIVRAATAQESTEHAPQDNQDSSFVNLDNLAGGIFDGAGNEGGEKAPKRASQDAAQAVEEVMKNAGRITSQEQVEHILRNALAEANKAVKRVPDGGVTTATVFKIWDSPDGERYVTVGNVGDSRAAIVKRDGTIISLTEDHNNLDGRLQAGTISAEDYQNVQKVLDEFENDEDPRLKQTIQVKGEDNVIQTRTIRQLYDRYGITRGLGLSNHTPDFYTHVLEEGDILLIHSDGIQDNLDKTSRESQIQQSDRSPEQIATRLVDMALLNSQVYFGKKLRAKHDDMTVMAISLESTAKAASPAESATESRVGALRPAEQLAVSQETAQQVLQQFINEGNRYTANGLEHMAGFVTVDGIEYVVKTPIGLDQSRYDRQKDHIEQVMATMRAHGYYDFAPVQVITRKNAESEEIFYIQRSLKPPKDSLKYGSAGYEERMRNALDYQAAQADLQAKGLKVGDPLNNFALYIDPKTSQKRWVLIDFSQVREIPQIATSPASERAPQPAGFTLQEIQQLGEQAHAFRLQKERTEPEPNDSTDPFSGSSSDMADLAVSLQTIPEALGRQFDAHGIDRGIFQGQNLQNETGQLSALSYVLTHAFQSQNEIPHSAPLKGDASQSAFGGDPLRSLNTGFILLSPRGGQLFDSTTRRFRPAAVLINEQWYNALPPLQKTFPDVQFIKANDPQLIQKLESVRPSAAREQQNTPELQTVANMQKIIKQLAAIRENPDNDILGRGST